MEHPAQKRYHYLIHSLACCFPTDETDEEEEIIEEYPQKETRRKKVRFLKRCGYSDRAWLRRQGNPLRPIDKFEERKAAMAHRPTAYLQVLGNGVTSLERWRPRDSIRPAGKTYMQQDLQAAKFVDLKHQEKVVGAEQWRPKQGGSIQRWKPTDQHPLGFPHCYSHGWSRRGRNKEGNICESTCMYIVQKRIILGHKLSMMNIIIIC